MLRPLTIAAVTALGFVSCQPPEWYGEEVVLWDSRWAQQNAQQNEQLDQGTPQQDPATSRPSPSETAASAPGASPVARIFELEAELDELDRAIRDGLDQDGALRRRRAEIETELVESKAEHADEYAAARRERLKALRRR